MQKLKNEFGRTMVEMLAVLAIIVAISIGISAGIGHGLIIYRASVIQTQLPQLAKAVMNIRSFGITHNNSDNFNYQEHFSDILGDSACTDSGCNTAAGPMYVKSGTDRQDFTIVFTKMPKKICFELETMGRGDNGLGIKELVMVTSCTIDAEQTVEFATTDSTDSTESE